MTGREGTDWTSAPHGSDFPGLGVTQVTCSSRLPLICPSPLPPTPEVDKIFHSGVCGVCNFCIHSNWPISLAFPSPRSERELLLQVTPGCWDGRLHEGPPEAQATSASAPTPESPRPGQTPHPQSCVRIDGEEVERARVHPPCEEAGPPGGPTHCPGVQFKGGKKPLEMVPLCPRPHPVWTRGPPCNLCRWAASQVSTPPLGSSGTLGGRLPSAFCQGP